jgi:hypothetical protein
MSKKNNLEQIEEERADRLAWTRSAEMKRLADLDNLRRHLEHCISARKWTEFAQTWSDETQKAQEAFLCWASFRNNVTLALRKTPGGDEGGREAAAKLAASGWPQAREALLKSRDWIAQRLAQEGFWLKKGDGAWALAELEAAAAPELLARESEKEPLASYLLWRRATAEEIDLAVSWARAGDSAWEWGERGGKGPERSALWGKNKRGLLREQMADWAARSESSAEGFSRHGFWSEDDAAQRLREALGRGMFDTLLEDAASVCGWLAALSPECATKALAGVRVERWLNFARSSIDPRSSFGSAPQERAISRLEAAAIRAAVSPRPPADPDARTGRFAAPEKDSRAPRL